MSNDETTARDGHCLCGAVRFVTQGRPVIVAHCYCRDCQRLTGSGHSTGAMFAERDVAIAGRTAEHTLQSNAGNTVTRVFCPACGSPIFGKNSAMVGFMTISLGLFDDASSFTPEVAIFTRSRLPWDSDAAHVESFAEQPEWRPS